MASTALERVLHYKCQEWSDSIRTSRSTVGFFFDLSDEELWQWLVSGGHARAREIAAREVRKLGAEEFYEYYLCCFYSRYELPSGTVDFEAIQGPPWVTFGAQLLHTAQNGRNQLKVRERNCIVNLV